MHDFTPWPALLGGTLIGLGASLLLIASGNLAGISGILSDLLLYRGRDMGWRVFFVAGLLGSGLVAAVIAPDAIESSPRSLGMLGVAGCLVGIGTRLGRGCTSGHGVCGVSRLSPRSIAATFVFLGTGMLAVRLVGGAS